MLPSPRVGAVGSLWPRRLLLRTVLGPVREEEMQHHLRDTRESEPGNGAGQPLARFLGHCRTCRYCVADMRSMRPFCRTGRYLASALTLEEIHKLAEMRFGSEGDS